MNFIEMKEVIKPLLEQFCGVSDEEAEDMIFNADEIDDGLIDEVLQEIGEQSLSASVVIDGLTVGDKEFSMDVSQIDDNEYLTLLTFGGCTDIVAANKTMSDYELSDWDSVISIENEVEEEGDLLVLSCSFIAKNGDELRNNISAIFEVLQNEEYKELLLNMLEHFE